MDNKEKIWIITELFSPDQTSTAYVLTHIANYLADSYEVEVICGPLNHLQKIDFNGSANNSNMKVTRIRSLNLNKNNLITRSIRLIMISIQLSIKYLSIAKKSEKVLIVTNPAPLLLIFALISTFSNRKIILLIHDVFPENAIAANIISNQKSFLYRTLKKIYDFAYSQFYILIVLGRDMKLVVSKKIEQGKKKAKIKTIENWADIINIYPLKIDDIALRMWNVQNKIVFLFAGNLGRTQALEELLLIIKRTKNPLLHFVFAGEGALKERLIKFVKINSLENVTIGNSFSRSEQCEILNSCHVGLVTLAKGMAGLGVPSKSYNMLAAGKPILFFGDENSEISLLVKENNIGWSHSSSDSLLEFFNQIDESYFKISKVLGQNSRIVAETKYSESVILRKFKEIL